VTDTDPEIEFLREVEDVFATLRGVPHLLSPKDVHLARTWFSDGVPLPAVTAGVTEVMEKRRAAEAGDPVVSLSYCRHAVRRHAKRIKELQAGAHTDAQAHIDTDRLIQDLAADLQNAAKRISFPETAENVMHFVARIEELQGSAPIVVDEQLFALETALLEVCTRTLPPEILKEIEHSATVKTSASKADASTHKRMRRALIDQEIRRLLDLPRLELV
jgi:hypothetical protein